MKKYFLLALVFSSLILISTIAAKPPKAYKVVKGTIEFAEPKRAVGQTDVIGLRAKPIENVRVAIIGVGMRGYDAVYRLSQIEGAQIKVIVDINEDNVKKAQKTLHSFNKPDAELFTGSEDWKNVCERSDIDLIYVCTHWQLHTPIAVYAMNHGKHVVMEVPAAISVKECWDLVNTAEKTRQHCMMLENCIYDFFELATLNMAQHGVFGELMYAEGAYIHDLRFLNFDEKGYWDMWRLKYNEKHTGNPYATHGLGPVSHALNIHRGDKMDFLVSVSTEQRGMTVYAEEKFGKDSEYAKRSYKLGDMSSTIIRTTKGKSILIQHDITSPRPYSRLHVLSGTKGFAQKYPTPGIALEPNAHEFLSKPQLDSLLKVWDHPFSKEIGEEAIKVGGHGGMDFIMDYRLIYCLRKGLPLDMDVYDAAEWSCIGEMSEASVLNGSKPVKFPDFTRGAWNKIDKLNYAK